jgi:hypothetical protein
MKLIRNIDRICNALVGLSIECNLIAIRVGGSNGSIGHYLTWGGSRLAPEYVEVIPEYKIVNP